MNHEWQACISTVDNSNHKVRWILDMKWINDWFYFHCQCYTFVHEQILQWVLYFKTSFWNYHGHSSSQMGNILLYTRWSVFCGDGCIRKGTTKVLGILLKKLRWIIISFRITSDKIYCYLMQLDTLLQIYNLRLRSINCPLQIQQNVTCCRTSHRSKSSWYLRRYVSTSPFSTSSSESSDKLLEPDTIIITSQSTLQSSNFKRTLTVHVVTTKQNIGNTPKHRSSLPNNSNWKEVESNQFCVVCGFDYLLDNR